MICRSLSQFVSVRACSWVFVGTLRLLHTPDGWRLKQFSHADVQPGTLLAAWVSECMHSLVWLMAAFVDIRSQFTRLYVSHDCITWSNTRAPLAHTSSRRMASHSHDALAKALTPRVPTQKRAAVGTPRLLYAAPHWSSTPRRWLTTHPPANARLLP